MNRTRFIILTITGFPYHVGVYHQSLRLLSELPVDGIIYRRKQLPA